MAGRTLKIWYDAEGNYLEVILDQRPGYFRETASDQLSRPLDILERLAYTRPN